MGIRISQFLVIEQIIIAGPKNPAIIHYQQHTQEHTLSTRSTIAIELADGTVKQVYCHSDGYLSYNGRILFEHYSDPAKLEELINLGDISVMGLEIGVKIDFNNRLTFTENNQATQCRIYGRDRGESGDDARLFWNFGMYEMTHYREEYSYILRNNGTWYVAIGEGGFIELAGALNVEAAT